MKRFSINTVRKFATSLDPRRFWIWREVPGIVYPSYEDFVLVLFHVVAEHMEFHDGEPLPDYAKRDGSELQKILALMPNDDYYPDLFAKAGYLFVSIIENHPYPNGNKRLALVAALYFLMINGVELKPRTGTRLKNLTKYVADRERNKGASFTALKEKAADFFRETAQNVT